MHTEGALLAFLAARLGRTYTVLAPSQGGLADMIKTLRRRPMTGCRPSSELSIQIRTGVITFSEAASGVASRVTVLVWALFADDDACAPANVTDSKNRGCLRFKCSSVSGMKQVNMLPGTN
jgi:hypothetical protein